MTRAQIAWPQDSKALNPVQGLCCQKEVRKLFRQRSPVGKKSVVTNALESTHEPCAPGDITAGAYLAAGCFVSLKMKTND